MDVVVGGRRAAIRRASVASLPSRAERSLTTLRCLEPLVLLRLVVLLLHQHLLLLLMKLLRLLHRRMLKLGRRSLSLLCDGSRLDLGL